MNGMVTGNGGQLVIHDLAREQFERILASGRSGQTLTHAGFEEVLHLAGRVHGPALLFDAVAGKLISPETLAAVIGSVWSGAEYPESMGRQAWLWLFAKAGYTCDGQAAERPSAPVTLWRGCPPSRVRRMSWTASPERARSFASDRLRGRQPGNVYMTVVPPAALLCFNGHASGRGEDEYVISPDGLTIQRVWTAGQPWIVQPEEAAIDLELMRP